jgi:hypothetical protein
VRVVVKEWNMGRICCVWAGHVRASDICALATEFRLPVARTLRALCMKQYCVCVRTAQLLLAVICSYTRVAVVGVIIHLCIVWRFFLPLIKAYPVYSIHPTSGTPVCTVVIGSSVNILYLNTPVIRAQCTSCSCAVGDDLR